MADPIPVNPSGNPDIDGLLWGSKWGQTNLLFSMPFNNQFLMGEYQGYGSINGYQQVTQQQADAVFSIMQKFDEVCGLTLTHTFNTGAGNLRFANCTTLAYKPGDPQKVVGGGNGTAEANVPSPEYLNYTQGDAWFSNNPNGDATYFNPIDGNFNYTAGFMHETGHALGLKHGHTKAAVFNRGFSMPALPHDHDSQEFSIMTYKRFVGDTPGKQPTFQQTDFPTTPMQDDIAALQYMYGADWATRNTSTTYSWSPSTGETFANGAGLGTPFKNYIFLTIWDAGGADTYDMSNYSNGVSIDLRPGRWSTTTKSQLADLDSTEGGHTARGSIFNALQFQGDKRSLIENATGGSGGDKLMGNGIANVLIGGKGGDKLNGGGGADDLFAGSDKAKDVFVFGKGDSGDSKATADHIFQFNRRNGDEKHTDKIDLSGIDADKGHKHDQDFRFVSHFSKAHGKEPDGEVKINDHGANVKVLIDFDGDKHADMKIVVMDIDTLHKADFIL